MGYPSVRSRYAAPTPWPTFVAICFGLLQDLHSTNGTGLPTACRLVAEQDRATCPHGRQAEPDGDRIRHQCPARSAQRPSTRHCP